MSPLRHVQRHVAQLDLRRAGRVFALGAIIGIAAGLGAIVFQYLCQWVQHVALDGLAGFRPGGPAGEVEIFRPLGTGLRLWALVLVPALGGLVTGALVQRFAPEAAGHGTDEAVDAYHRRGGVVRARVPMVKTLASAITLGTGGSGGREGPIAQIGAGVGSLLGVRLGLSERDRRVLLAAGVGAGVGSIFRAPLAGALFAAEVLYSDTEFESDVVIPAAVASMVAYCVFSLRFGFGTLFHTPAFDFHSPLELLPYSALALVLALAVGLFVNLFYGMHALFARMVSPKWLRPALGGLLTGAVAVTLHLLLRQPRVLDVMAFGYGSIQEALAGGLGIPVLLAIALGKMLTTSLSIGSGGSGGVFGPSMVIGGAVGGVVGLVAQRLMPGVVTQPGAFVVVGMAGFFSAAANTPISTLVMVSEMTGSYRLLLPTMWVCTFAYVLGRRWNLYRNQVRSRLESPAHRGSMFVDVLQGLRVSDVARERPVHVVPEWTPLSEVIRAFAATAQRTFPVVDDSGAMTGVLSIDDIRQLLDEEQPDGIVIAHDLARPPAATLRPGDDLDTALQHFVANDAEELPVTDADGRRVVALLSRRDVMAAYNQARLERGRRREAPV